MRKINLKKQLAFISSLALIAGTAMYMPANAGEILGISHSVSADEAEKNIVTYAYEDLKPMVMFNANGGKFSNGDELITINDGNFSSITDPTKVGYKFAGWSKDGGETIISDLNSETFDTTTTLVAQWTPITYTINLNTDGVNNPTANYGETTKVNCSNAVKEDYYLWGFSKVDGATVPDAGLFVNAADGCVLKQMVAQYIFILYGKKNILSLLAKKIINYQNRFLKTQIPQTANQTLMYLTFR